MYQDQFIGDVLRHPSNRIPALVADLAGVRMVHGRSACPIHGGGNKSAFSAFNRGGRPMWRCHSGDCGSGGAIQLIQKIRGLRFRDALEMLAGRAGIPLPPPEFENTLTPEQEARRRANELFASILACAENIEQVNGDVRSGTLPPASEILKRLRALGYKDEEILKTGLDPAQEPWLSGTTILWTGGERARAAISRKEHALIAAGPRIRGTILPIKAGSSARAPVVLANSPEELEQIDEEQQGYLVVGRPPAWQLTDIAQHASEISIQPGDSRESRRWAYDIGRVCMKARPDVAIMDRGERRHLIEWLIRSCPAQQRSHPLLAARIAWAIKDLPDGDTSFYAALLQHAAAEALGVPWEAIVDKAAGVGRTNVRRKTSHSI